MAKVGGDDSKNDDDDRQEEKQQQQRQRQRQRQNRLLVSLTDSSSYIETAKNSDAVTTPSRVGGKASSLAKLYATEGLSSNVPKAYALSVDFFQTWINEMKQSMGFKYLLSTILKNGDDSADDNDDDATTKSKLCEKLQRNSYELPLSTEQSDVLQQLVDEMNSSNWNEPKLAAVRSSAPEEDGSGASFAGAFETKLGVAATLDSLEKAVRDCFASLWDYRVLDYKIKNSTKELDDIGFALVVMEMIDSKIAGVAFTANPLNSDRDEAVIDSSWGLGESVVDGTVTADRYVVNKVSLDLIQQTLGVKGNEKRLLLGASSEGGVMTKTIDEDDPRRTGSSLTESQIQQLTKLICFVEKEYGMPMDIEWAFIDNNGTTTAAEVDDDDDDTEKKQQTLELKLLQARPITTLFTLDEKMMTSPTSSTDGGVNKRRLYFDMNIMSEATTTSPFTTIDMEYFNKVFQVCFGMSVSELEAKNWSAFSSNPDMLFVFSSTRQYVNMSLVLKYFSNQYMSEKMKAMDPYLASIMISNDCNREKYRANKLPDDMTFTNVWNFMKEFPLWSLYKISTKYNGNPEQAKKEYMEIIEKDMGKLSSIGQARKDDPKICQSLKKYSEELLEALQPSLTEECSMINFVLLSMFGELDEQRRNGATEEIKEEYEALCGGYIGDELMETNIAMYRLSRKLPESLWNEYDDSAMKQLSERIDKNMTSLFVDKKNEEECDLPIEFLNEWKQFMERYGYDGLDQLFMSCPRYDDSPELLLSKLRLNAIGDVVDPSKTQRDQVLKRRNVMAKQEEEANSTSFWPFRYYAVSKIQKRNAILEHLMWIRNAPKLHLAKVFGMIRAEVLRIEDKFIESGRLKDKGDIFHLRADEVDKAILEIGGGEEKKDDDNIDLMKIIKPRKAVYERALRSKVCPLLVDSRCRILQPDPPSYGDGEEPEPGTLIGSAVSPGVATGRVRIVNNPSEKFENGEVLCAVVTGPAWTPMFASASAVVLQIGGVLQHGALCAREYGKPAISNIDIHNLLKDGMMVTVDGNTGIVKILKDNSSNDDDSQS